MDHIDEGQRDIACYLWQALDRRDKQALLQCYSTGAPSADFFINILAPTKLIQREPASAAVRTHEAVALSRVSAKQDFAVQRREGLDREMLAELESAKLAARVACFVEIASHLEEFAQQHPFSSYEEWIAELHPESVRAGESWGAPVVDYRYYLEDSDHRVLWNAKVGASHAVPSRSPEPNGYKGSRNAAAYEMHSPRTEHIEIFETTI
jgi:hypothetical protein